MSAADLVFLEPPPLSFAFKAAIASAAAGVSFEPTLLSSAGTASFSWSLPASPVVLSPPPPAAAAFFLFFLLLLLGPTCSADAAAVSLLSLFCVCARDACSAAAFFLAAFDSLPPLFSSCPC